MDLAALSSFLLLVQIVLGQSVGSISVNMAPASVETVIDHGVFYQFPENMTFDDESMQPLPSTTDDNVTTIEGDIMIDGIPEDLRTPQELSTRSRRKVAGGLWPNNIVPWKVNSNLPAYSAIALKRIKTAIGWWAENTCIRFVPASSRPRDKALEFNNEEMCSSFVGYQSSKKKKTQRIRLLESRCISSPGTPAHEIGHALGLVHEHTRMDRDEYITINPEAIGSSIGNYRKSYSSSIPPGVGYDVGSIMHYSGKAFTSKIRNKQSMMGQRKALGFYDIKAINLNYQCKGHCNNRCENEGYPYLSNGKCVCVCPEGLTGDHCEKVDRSCGSVINLRAEGTAKVESPGYPNRPHKTDKKCWWLVKAPAGYFIEINFSNVDVAQTQISLTTGVKCIHQLEIRNNLLGQRGDMYCGQGKLGPFNTELGQVNDKMMIGLDMSDKNGVRGRGFSATVRAYQDACVSNPCHNEATCESRRSSQFTCHCRDGYSGRLCDVITDGGLNCDFRDGMCGLANAHDDQLDFHRGFLFSKYGEKLQRTSWENSYFLATPVEYKMKPSSEARLQTTSSFSSSTRSVRCLTFYSKIEGHRWQDGELTVRLVDPRNSAPIKTLTTLTKTNGSGWKPHRIQISQSKDYKIEFSFKTSKKLQYNSLMGLDDIRVMPHRCSGGPCSSNPCVGDGSVCVEKNANSYKCICPPGRTGVKCSGFAVSDAEGLLCDFDRDCGWTHDKSGDFEWFRTQGASDSKRRTGPTSAVGGSGFYMVADTSHSKVVQGSVARMISPPLRSKGDLCVGFYYHMSGIRKVGSLRLKMKSGGRIQPQKYFEKSGSQSKDWIYTEVDVRVPNSNSKLIFEATAGSRHLSDIAIDDVKMTKGRCKSESASSN